MLLGNPVYTDPDVPVMAASAKSILYGDFSWYWIRDVNGILIQRLNELFAMNGQVGFIVFHRTDGKLVNTAAVKHLANAAS
jgi:HK97 family phage major capsid protein